MFLLRDRGQAGIVIPWLIRHIDASTGRKVAYLHADGAREFSSKELQDFFDSRGIKFEVTIPYTSQQNGTAERANRTIMERTRGLIIESGLPQHLWGEAAVAAILITNTAPTTTKRYGCNKEREPLTPFEAWTGLQSDCGWLVKWGSDAWKHTKTNSKLNERSKKYKLVGWEGTQIFRLWDPDDNSIHRSRDVVFNEQPDDTPSMMVQSSSQEDHTCEYDEPLTCSSPALCLMRKESPEKLQDLSDGDFDVIPEFNTYLDNKELIKSNTLDDDSEESNIVLSTESDVPATLKEARESRDWPYWDQGIKEEIAKLETMGTYTIVEKPEVKDCKILSGKWVFDRKTDDKEHTIRFRARWVVRGCLQRHGVHYDATYAAVVKWCDHSCVVCTYRGTEL